MRAASKVFMVLALAAPIAACAEPRREWVRVPAMAAVQGDPERDAAQCSYEIQGAPTPGRKHPGRSPGVSAPGLGRGSVENCMKARGWEPKQPPS